MQQALGAFVLGTAQGVWNLDTALKIYFLQKKKKTGLVAFENTNVPVSID